MQSTQEALRLLKQGKEDTGLDPSTSDWQKLGLTGRPGPEAIQGKPSGLATGGAMNDFRAKKESMTSDFERPGEDQHSQATQHVSEAESRSLTKIKTSDGGRSLLIPIILAIVLLGGGVGAYYLFFASGSNSVTPPANRRTTPVRRSPVVRVRDREPVRRLPAMPKQPDAQLQADAGSPMDTGSKPDLRQPEPRRVVIPRRQIPPTRPRTKAPVRTVPDARHPAYRWPSSATKMCRFFLKICMKSCVKTRLGKGDPQAEDHCKKNCWRMRKTKHGQKFCQ